MLKINYLAILREVDRDMFSSPDGKKSLHRRIYALYEAP